jgi:hypothetical protein
MRDMLSRMFVKGGGEWELLSLIHVRMKLPDKREVGSSTLPRPITFNEGRHAKRPPAEADGLSTQQVK